MERGREGERWREGGGNGTPHCQSDNVLYISDDGSQGALYLGAFKTVKTMGPQKIHLSQLEHVLEIICIYRKKHQA